jgi:hypothetical protein
MLRAVVVKSHCSLDSVIGRDGDDILLKNFEGKVFRYPDPIATYSPLLYFALGRNE